MPSSIVVDPVQVRTFINQIYDNVAQLEKQIPETERAFETVAQSWKDEQFTKFKTRFEEDMQKIKPLCNALHEYEEILTNYERKLLVYTNF